MSAPTMTTGVRTTRTLERPTAVVTGLPSDAHTWNLVYVQLLLEELGFDVVNLGPCVPADLLVEECLHHRPDLLVVSSVNGHGHIDGVRVASRLRAEPLLAGIPAVIGGKLGIAGGSSNEQLAALAAAGFDLVFDDGAPALERFTRFARSLHTHVSR